MEAYESIRKGLVLAALIGATPVAPSQLVKLQAVPEATISATEKRQIQEEVAPAQTNSERTIFVDTKSLEKKGQIFVLTVDRRHCMSARIFARHPEWLEKVWQVDRLPTGAPICSSTGCPGPWASVAPGRITISYATRNANGNGCSLSRVRYDPIKPSPEPSMSR